MCRLSASENAFRRVQQLLDLVERRFLRGPLEHRHAREKDHRASPARQGADHAGLRIRTRKSSTSGRASTARAPPRRPSCRSLARRGTTAALQDRDDALRARLCYCTCTCTCAGAGASPRGVSHPVDPSRHYSCTASVVLRGAEPCHLVERSVRPGSISPSAAGSRKRAPLLTFMVKALPSTEIAIPQAGRRRVAKRDPHGPYRSRLLLDVGEQGKFGSHGRSAAEARFDGPFVERAVRSSCNLWWQILLWHVLASRH
jgi:hypothetical protein